PPWPPGDGDAPCREKGTRQDGKLADTSVQSSAPTEVFGLRKRGKTRKKDFDQGYEDPVNEATPSTGSSNDAVLAKLASFEEELKQLRLTDVKSTQVVMAEVCGCCSETGHGGHECPCYMESTYDPNLEGVPYDINAIQGYALRVQNDPYSNTYNPGWRNHPNFSWRDPKAGYAPQSDPQQAYSQPRQYAPPNNRPPFQPRPEFQGYQPRPEFQGYQQGRRGFVPRQPMPSPPEPEKEVKAPTSDPRIDNINKYLQSLASTVSTLHETVKGDNEKVMISEVASTTIPRKECDPGGFVIKITLRNGKETNGMLDLVAGINLMSYSIFKQLELGDLKPTRMCLQLADRTLRYPKGIIEDILIRVGNLIFPANFVVLDVGEVPNTGNEHTILLGRPFMATTNTLINVKDGRVTLSALGETVTFTMSEVKTTSSFTESCSYVDVIEAGVHNLFHADVSCECGVPDEDESKKLDFEEEGVVDLIDISKEPEPREILTELKPLPLHLKY
ncbi:Unknown protein, partial [Striga hermonthica]